MQQKYSHFSAEDFENLSPPERGRHCREMAKRALALAQAAPPNHRKAYSEIARQWGELADDIERAGSGLSP